MSEKSHAYFASLDGGHPPAGLEPPLTAVWHGLRNDWDLAHSIVQDQDDADSAWVHAWLHRVEGDQGNAAYWYRRAGKPTATGDLRKEGEAIAHSLLGD